MTALISKLQQSLAVRALAHRATFFLGTRFPDNFPFVFVLGFPKSGTTWACQLVADYLRLPFPQFSMLPHTFECVIHGHQIPTPRHTPLAYVVRDGRDAAVSFFHFELRHVRAGHPERLAKQVKAVFPKNPTSPEQCFPHFNDFLEVFFQNPPATAVAWHTHVRRFIEQRTQRQGLLRYEHLVSEGPEELGRCIADITGDTPEPDRLRWAIDKYDFSRQKKKADPTALRRKGGPGDWKNHFDPAAAQLFRDRAGDLLISLGYEQDNTWADHAENDPPALRT